MDLRKSIFYTKPMSSENTVEQPGQLRRCLTAFDLTMLGIGAIIGAGVFVLTGIAAATQAGPGVIFSYVLAGLACGFSAFAYAELASSIGGCGSAYGYAYAGMGEFIAWLIGWALILEYGMNCSTISIGWSAYVENALTAVGIHLPKILLNGPFDGGLVNLPAVMIIFAIAGILSLGAKESSKFNRVIVYVKLAVIFLFIGITMFYFEPAKNWKPFLPFGWTGIVNGAGLIFFAYIGFDAVSTAAEESINPQRDLPIGIISSLVICTIIYVIVAALLTGATDYASLNVGSPVAMVLLKLGYRFAGAVVALGAIAGLTTTILVMYYALTRIMLAMSRDGLLPNKLVKIHEKSHSPRRLIWSSAVIMASAAGFFPIHEIANLVNIGTLAAFVVVCAGVIVMRYTKPDMKRPFKTPASPYIPLMGIFMCLYLMSSLPAITWWSFGLWMVAGIVIYFVYSRANSLFVRKNLALQQSS